MNRLITLLLVVLAWPVSAQNIRGTWSGELNAGMMKLALVLHVDNDSTCRLDSPDQGAKDIAGQVAYISAALQKPWYDFFIDYAPQPDIARIACPVMAMNGGKDRHVVAAQNLRALRQWLPKHGSNVIKEYPGLNHLFQHCQTGMPAEYGEIEETFSEEVLQDILEWINNLKLYQLW